MDTNFDFTGALGGHLELQDKLTSKGWIHEILGGMNWEEYEGMVDAILSVGQEKKMGSLSVEFRQLNGEITILRLVFYDQDSLPILFETKNLDEALAIRKALFAHHK